MTLYNTLIKESVFDFLDNSTATILISLSIMLFAGFLLTRVTKKLKLPNVSAYIITGVLLGPIFYLVFQKTLINDNIVNGMGFLSDIALAFIAFNVGRFFKLDVLKESGLKVVVITLFEVILSALLVFSVMFFIFNISFELSLLLASIASATSPASTMMTIRQTKSKGHFVNTVLQVIALDSAISLLLFSVSLAIITSGGIGAMVIFQPLLINLGIIILGGLLGWVLHKLIIESRTADNRLIIVISLLLALSGLSAVFEVSPLLGCMVMGTVYLNLSKDTSIFKQIDQFSPAILTLFFVLSGMRLRLDMLGKIGILGLVYFGVRIIGKYAGASLGSVVSNSTTNNKKYLGLALIPQAGVALGLAALGSRILESYNMFDEAAILSTIIIAAGILYEIVGPPSAKLSLYLSESYDIDRAKT